MKLTIVKDRLTAPSVQFYRTSGVFKTIPGLQVTELSSQEALTFESWLWDTDLLLIERFWTEESLAIIRKAKAYNVKLVLDDDDDRLNIPEYMSVATLAYYSDRGFKERLVSALQAADLIFVSTEALKQSYQRLTASKIIIVRNAIPDHIWPEPRVIRTTAGEHPIPLIAWRGSDKHLGDLETNWDAFNISGVQYLFFGEVPGMRLKVAKDAMILPFGQMWQYFNTLRLNNPEWLAVPLNNNAFNEAKSDLAFLEGTWIGGAAIIAPEWLPEFYHDGVLHYGDKGLPYLIKGIKNNKYKSFTYYNEAVQYIKNNRLLSKVNEVRQSELNLLRKC